MNDYRFSTTACTAFLKALLLAFNIIFFTLGIGFMIIGIYGLQMLKDFFLFTSGFQLFIPIICIGLFMVIVGILSLWCTPKGLIWLLYVYSFIIFLLFAVTFAISVLFMVKRAPLETELDNSMQHAMNIYPRDAISIDTIQSSMKCCGSNNYTDWFKTEFGRFSNSVPQSCCIYGRNCTTNNVTDDSNIYKEGCYKLVTDLMEKNYVLIGSLGFACTIVILVGSLLSFLLALNLRKNHYETVE